MLSVHKKRAALCSSKQTVRLLFILSERSRVHVSAGGEEEDEEEEEDEDEEHEEEDDEEHEDEEDEEEEESRYASFT